MDHLSTTSAYTSNSLWLLHTFTRQLVSYVPSVDFAKGSQVAADLAEEIPTIENGGISSDGRTCTFQLRQGVRWNSQPARAVTAYDVERGIKLLCNPVVPTEAPGYYVSTIAGMQSFCDEFAKVRGVVDNLSYVNSPQFHSVAIAFRLSFNLQPKRKLFSVDLWAPTTSMSATSVR